MPNYSMRRIDAIRIIIQNLEDELVVHANGMICRESFFIKDRPQNFYMLGSMGQAPAIGLGIALSLPHRLVIIFDGDGNILMNLGILALVGALKPKNFLHLCFDNEVYGSTGDQPTISGQVPLEELARAAGYAMTGKICQRDELEERIKGYLKEDGPIFVLIKVNREVPEKVARIPYSPEIIKERFISTMNV